MVTKIIDMAPAPDLPRRVFIDLSDLGARAVAKALALDLYDRSMRLRSRGFKVMAGIAAEAADHLYRTARRDP